VPFRKSKLGPVTELCARVKSTSCAHDNLIRRMLDWCGFKVYDALTNYFQRFNKTMLQILAVIVTLVVVILQ